MNQATLAKISEFLSSFAELLFKMSGLGFWLFVGGFILLLVLFAVLVAKSVLIIVRAIPNLTISQFIKLIVVLALVLIVTGLLVP